MEWSHRKFSMIKRHLISPAFEKHWIEEIHETVRERERELYNFSQHLPNILQPSPTNSPNIFTLAHLGALVMTRKPARHGAPGESSMAIFHSRN
jgi:hypothetical protein